MKPWTQVPAGEINAATQRFWVAVGNNADKVAELINTDSVFVTEMARRVVDEARGPTASGDQKSSTDVQLAYRIMGDNFFGTRAAIRNFNMDPNNRYPALVKVPFSEEVLIACKDTHVLIAVFPISILDIFELHMTLFNYQDWYMTHKFARSKGEASWHLIRKTPVENSGSKTWDKQQTLLQKDEGVPTIRVLVYTMISYYIATGNRLFENVIVRCSDVDREGHHVEVEYSDSYKLNLYRSTYRDARGNTVITSVKKPA